MSAGQNDKALTVDSDPTKLAPRFRLAVERALAKCSAMGRDAFIYEAFRSDALQQLYYARGRTQIPPLRAVTNASSNLFSWHGYGLAVDVISRRHGWDWGDLPADQREAAMNDWYADVAGCFRAEGCRWGGEWKMRDIPHFQWGLCKPSPSDQARQLLASGGLPAVWDAVGASSEAGLEIAPQPPPSLSTGQIPGQVAEPIDGG